MVLINQFVTVPITVLIPITILGHLRGLYVGKKYRYKLLPSLMNLQVRLGGLKSFLPLFS